MDPEESGLKGHYQLQSKFKGSLDNMRTCLKRKKVKEEEEKAKREEEDSGRKERV